MPAHRVLLPSRCKALLILAAVWVTVAASAGFAQTDPPSRPAPPSQTAPAKPLQFDAVSIKPDKVGSGGMFRIMSQPDGFTINAPLKMFLSFAFGIKQDLISGTPGWADDARYDIHAKVDGSDVDELHKLRPEQRNRLLQTILTDRFQLKSHFEIKELPIYDLVVAKSGPKLQEAKAGDTYANGIKGPDGVAHAGMMRMGSGQFSAQAITLSGLLDALSQELHRTVVDKTGLTGQYDIALKWTPDNGSAPLLNGQPDTSAPDIFTAVEEQLGLKLVSTKGPVKTLVIDHVEPPSEN